VSRANLFFMNATDIPIPPLPAEQQALLQGPAGHVLRPLWALQPGMHFLNHGSYGATPRHVLAVQDAWRARMEAQPVDFMSSELPGALRQAAAALGAFVGCAPERLALVENATDGVNAVLRSYPWQAGDEVVVANHAYPAVRHTLGFVAQRHGLLVKHAEVPFPLPSRQALADAYCQAITARTRLAIVDHVFSPLALVTPLEEVVAHCRALGVAVLVDGAHAPGMLPLRLDALGADWYTGNCHKWLFAPKGCAFLHASEAGAARLVPTVISNFHGQGFPAEFDWQGTRDYSGWLALPAAVDFLNAFGAARYQAALPAMAAEMAAMLAARWGVALPAPPDAFAALVTLPLPGTPEASDANARQWHDRLWQRHRIEVPVMCFNQRLWLRISAQVYNEATDYAALAGALPAELAAG
jgi:isopenicillin-N epimerase